MQIGQTFERLALLLHRFGAVLVLAIAVLSLVDAGLRNFANSPLVGTPELVVNALVILVFCQTPWVILNRRLLRITILTDALPRHPQRHLEAFAYVVGAGFFLAIAFYSLGPAVQSWVRNEFFGPTMFRIPSWPLRFSTMALWLFSAVACVIVAIRLYSEPIRTGSESSAQRGEGEG